MSEKRITVEETRLDRLIRYGDRAKRNRQLAIPKRKLLFSVALWVLYLVALSAGIVECFYIAIPAWSAFLIVLLWTAWFASKMLWYEEKFRRLYETFWIPLSIQCRGHKLYGFDEDAYISIVECHECHFPGDCPICGAE